MKPKFLKINVTEIQELSAQLAKELGNTCDAPILIGLNFELGTKGLEDVTVHVRIEDVNGHKLEESEELYWSCENWSMQDVVRNLSAEIARVRTERLAELKKSGLAKLSPEEMEALGLEP